ncbi:cytochrome c oxidase subunit 3 [Actinomycetospora endophytica]|uniref:Cytochrome aa3 subunit 3 n=1 Tax=Actinomycetospora endophytica TaxID=2291215 RepID=A0ABS8PC91_9PSEU|nr:cytochrome c oxidase subunit 3 [Actinomycetospora endophytica]MCD2194604.1 cytochrome c oxidase subunit 3 [Actinomycetospora endophytica]
MSAAPPAEREAPVSRTPGETGIWIFVLGDMVVFAVCFVVLAVTYAHDRAAYAADQQALHLGLGIVNTVVLVTTSLTMALAVRAARLARPRTAVRLVVATMAGAVVFAAVKVVEYTDLVVAGHTARSDDFFLYYFCFTGLHLLHVVIGLAVLGGVLRIVRRPVLGRADLSLVESGASYWHMVDLLWLVLFGLLYTLG